MQDVEVQQDCVRVVDCYSRATEGQIAAVTAHCHQALVGLAFLRRLCAHQGVVECEAVEGAAAILAKQAHGVLDVQGKLGLRR